MLYSDVEWQCGVDSWGNQVLSGCCHNLLLNSFLLQCWLNFLISKVRNWVDGADED